MLGFTLKKNCSRQWLSIIRKWLRSDPVADSLRPSHYSVYLPFMSIAAELSCIVVHERTHRKYLKDRELFLAREFHTGLTPGWLGNVHFVRYPLHVVSKIICMDPRIGLSLPACRK